MTMILEPARGQSTSGDNEGTKFVLSLDAYDGNLSPPVESLVTLLLNCPINYFRKFCSSLVVAQSRIVCDLIAPPRTRPSESPALALWTFRNAVSDAGDSGATDEDSYYLIKMSQIQIRSRDYLKARAVSAKGKTLVCMTPQLICILTWFSLARESELSVNTRSSVVCGREMPGPLELATP
ncbi:hypothetical protein RF11_04639 [Thelohanellus kitauei]|uniref:Uncharacterized protein n=1 Tax=Thelohanellus kitauei TaxID=669202 RepID=A0A0C2NK08_THEKT|nr:hypothetical protein RF11_04639 [Thelohanellus kitauei]